MKTEHDQLAFNLEAAEVALQVRFLALSQAIWVHEVQRWRW